MNNHCIYDMLLWRCSSDTYSSQQKCDFYFKLPGRQCCLWLYVDGRCGNIDAHKNKKSEDYVGGGEE